jgi:RNA polymerase sigma factor (sigma-70 family)
MAGRRCHEIDNWQLLPLLIHASIFRFSSPTALPNKSELMSQVNSEPDKSDHAFSKSGVIDWVAIRSFLSKVLGSKVNGKLQAKIGKSDIVQRSLIDVQGASVDLGSFSPALAKAWLKRLAIRNMIDVHRRFAEAECRDVNREESIETTAIFDRSARTPSSIVSKKELDHDLLRAISKLTPDQQKLVRLRHQDNLGFERIGMELGISEEGARKRWNKILDILRNELVKREE